MRRIESEDDIAAGLAALADLDPRLAAVIARAGPVPLRRRPPGFEGLARIIVAQQISVSAATAIWTRFAALVDPLDPARLLAASAEDLRGAGLSAPKVRTLWREYLRLANAPRRSLRNIWSSSPASCCK